MHFYKAKKCGERAALWLRPYHPAAEGLRNITGPILSTESRLLASKGIFVEQSSSAYLLGAYEVPQDGGCVVTIFNDFSGRCFSTAMWDQAGPTRLPSPSPVVRQLSG